MAARRRARSPVAVETANILDSLRRLIRFLRVATRRAEQRTGASAAQLFVLSQLAESPGISLTELAERTLTDPSSVSTVVARLVAAGHVARRPAPGDRRRAVLSLTRSGRRLVDHAPELAQVRIVSALAAMRPADRRTLRASLERLVGAVGADTVAPRMLFEDEQ